MNYTQNRKIMQVTETTLVVGVDIGSQWHYARAFDWRGIELTRKVFRFSNNLDGYIAFEEWVKNISEKSAKMDILIGCEPTGHYWFTFAKYVKEHGMKLAFVNPYHVKQSKEMDDNSPRKTDQKDPKTIAKLVTEGRYSFPYIPDGIYAELREAISVRDQIVKALNATANRIQRWLKIYFPEYLEVYKVFDSVSGLAVLKKAPLPKDVVEFGTDEIVKLWRENKLRGVGKKRALTLVAAAKRSVGLPGGNCARMELQLLLEDYSKKKEQLDLITAALQEETLKVPNVEKLLAVKGVGIITVAGFLAEVGDIGRFTSPKQIQKLAGLEPKENSSGKHKGRSSISKRGRRKLRRLLFQVVLPLIRNNEDFREVYTYYTTRKDNPLKGMQAMIAVCCKVIRIFYALLTHGMDYSGTRFRADIIRPESTKAA